MGRPTIAECLCVYVCVSRLSSKTCVQNLSCPSCKVTSSSVHVPHAMQVFCGRWRAQCSTGNMAVCNGPGSAAQGAEAGWVRLGGLENGLKLCVFVPVGNAGGPKLHFLPWKVIFPKTIPKSHKNYGTCKRLISLMLFIPWKRPCAWCGGGSPL